MARVHIPAEQSGDAAAYAWDAYGGPMAAAGFAFSRAVYRHSRLSLRESEAARVRTAQINGCRICMAWRGAADTPALLAAAGEEGPSVVDNGPAPEEAFYRAIGKWRGSPLFSERERIALEFAERIAAEPQGLAADDPFWARARALFDDAEIVDLTLSVASWMAMGRATHVLGLDQSCPFPGTAPATA